MWRERLSRGLIFQSYKARKTRITIVWRRGFMGNRNLNRSREVRWKPYNHFDCIRETARSSVFCKWNFDYRNLWSLRLAIVVNHRVPWSASQLWTKRWSFRIQDSSKCIIIRLSSLIRIQSYLWWKWVCNLLGFWFHLDHWIIGWWLIRDKYLPRRKWIWRTIIFHRSYSSRSAKRLLIIENFSHAECDRPLRIIVDQHCSIK